MSVPFQTVQQSIIYPAARIAGIIQSSQRGPSPSDLIDMLQCLNTMLDEWAMQRLLVYHVIQSIQQINSNQQEYTIGPGQEWDIDPVPVSIEFADLIQILSGDNNPTYMALTILSPQDWFSIGVPNITSSTPIALYYERSIPYGTVSLYPVPQVANQIALGIWDTISQFSSLTQPVVLPQGYVKALQYNLAKELSCRVWHSGKPLGMNELALQEAASAMAWVKSRNRTNLDLEMRCESGSMGSGEKGRWDITSNQYRFG